MTKRYIPAYAAGSQRQFVCMKDGKSYIFTTPMRGIRGNKMPTWEQIHKALETVRAEAHEQFEKAIREMQIPDCPIETFRDAAKEMYNSLGKTSACADFFAALSKLEREESVPLDIRKAFDIMDVN